MFGVGGGWRGEVGLHGAGCSWRIEAEDRYGPRRPPLRVRDPHGLKRDSVENDVRVPCDQN